MTTEEFIQALEEKGVTLTPEQLDQFELYYELLVEWNEKINLTAITDKKDVYLKHFYDSLMPLWTTDLPFETESIIDVGAGAGFPSIPLVIAKPSLSVTIVDSLNKRIQFLDTLIDELKLTNVQAIHGRAEEVGQNKKYRGQFDIATARAVAQLNILAEFCIPLVKKGGHFIALKGHQAEEETEHAQNAIKTLGAKYEKTVTDKLPIEESDRAIIIIRKTLDTPNKYPRRPGKPAKKPL